MKISHLKQKLALTAGYIAAVAAWRLLGWPCLFTCALGIPCPGCGMTRALLAALRLDLAAAFALHPMFWSVPLLYLYFLSDNGLFHRKALDRALLIGVACGFLLQWGYRVFTVLL